MLPALRSAPPSTEIVIGMPFSFTADTKSFAGITGQIAIDPSTGNRVDVPVVILAIDAGGKYQVDPDWARFAGFATP